MAKSIKNKEVTVAGAKTTYGELMKICINKPPQGGILPEEMKARVRLLDVIEKEDEKLTFEDADASKLQQCVKAFGWAVVDKELDLFNEAIEKMT